MQKRWTAVVFPCFLILGLSCVQTVAADSLTPAHTGNPADIWDQGGGGDMPGFELSGWFQDLNPSNQWTSASNYETMEQWLEEVAELSGIDPSLLDRLLGFGMIAPGGSGAPSDGDPHDAATPDVPEPVTMVLVGGGLVLCGIWAKRRNTLL